MSKKHKSSRKKQRKWEERSDRRTAEFLVKRLDEIQSDLGDLIPDLQTFNHYWEISVVSLCQRFVKELRKKYDKLSDGHAWEDSE